MRLQSISIVELDKESFELLRNIQDAITMQRESPVANSTSRFDFPMTAGIIGMRLTRG